MHDPKLTLYPDWTGPKTALPPWVLNFGLLKCRPILSRVYLSAAKWQQAEQDGIGNVAPMIVHFNADPRGIKELVGREVWRKIHHATLKSNVDRLVLCRLAGWTIEEAMLFPTKGRRRARAFLEHGKSALLLACRLARHTDEIREFLIMAQDVQRMGGNPDPAWGRKRLRREHDALALKRAFDSCDPTPWARPWYHDVGAYSFALLKSESELAMEGACQRHCVRSYARACRAGTDVVLRIDGAKRATCSWRVGDRAIQVKGFANSKVSAECLAAAKKARAAYSYHLTDLAGKGGQT